MSRLAAIGDAPLAVEVNSIGVGSDGSLTVTDPQERPVAFGFEFLGVHFSGGTRLVDGRPRLRLDSNLMALPYTIESAPARRRAFAIMDACRRLGCERIALSADRNVTARGEIAVEPPLTAAALIAATTRLVLELQPVLELFAELAIVRPARNAGAPAS